MSIRELKYGVGSAELALPTAHLVKTSGPMQASLVCQSGLLAFIPGAITVRENYS